MVKKIGVLATMLLIIALVINFSDAQATLIDIKNAGFEDQKIENGDWTERPGSRPLEWGLYFENGRDSFASDSYDFGVWNPRGDYAPEGSNVGYVYFDAAENDVGVFGFKQRLSATLTAGMTYSLQVDVGNTDYYDGFSGYRIELRAGGELLAFDENTLTLAENEFDTSLVSYTAQAGDPIGQALAIRLLNLQQHSGWNEVDFDNVRLDASPVPTPEPATMLLLGTGLIGLAGFGRKKLFRK